MSPILINSTSQIPTVPKHNFVQDEEKGEEDTEKAREERKAVGRSISIIIFLSLMCLALYHVIQRKTTILAGVLVPALILFAYTFFVIHISNRDKKRRKQLEADELELSSQNNVKIPPESLRKNLKVQAPTPIVSLSTAPSTSSSQTKVKTSKSKSTSKSDQIKITKTLNDHKTNASVGNNGRKIPSSNKKTPSQPPHIQVKSNHSTHVTIENEFKNLKKSRSFDRNNHLESRQTPIDNKKIKTKH